MTAVVDISWTKKQLQAECRRRGLKGCSALDKDGLIQRLNGTAAGNNGAAHGTTLNPSTESTVAELRKECKRRGLKNYSKFNKEELIRFLKDKKGAGKKGTGKVQPPEPTLEELRAECKKRGMTGFSHLNKKELIKRMEDYTLSGRAISRTKGASKGGRGRGPLRSRAQERFDAGPTEFDTPGFLYLYFEPGGGKDEWKIGKTILDPPERRMLQSASNNGKAYKLRASWRVPWCGYVEKVVHLDLDDLRIVPGKEKKGGGGREDGGTEWFCGDVAVMEARIKLVIRMVAAREADAADSVGCAPFCGMFRCGLPCMRRRANVAS